MSRKLVPPPNMVEQDDLRSGPLERSGFEDMGVIYATYDNASPDDFDTRQLLGATLVNPAIPEPDNSFTILGGYFTKQVKSNGQDAVITSKVFGIASKVSDVREGGDKILGDSWVMKDISDPTWKVKFLDERTRGKDGWVFLLTFKPSRAEYPFSGKGMEIFVANCPTISFEKYEFKYPKPETAELSFTLKVDDGPVDELEWDFGDGSPTVKTKKEKITHTYERDFGDTKVYKVTVKSKGPGDCTDTAEINIKIPPQPHPALTEVSEVKRTPLGDGSKVKVDFEAKLADPNNPHTSYIWNFGDGTERKSDSLKESHEYHAAAPKAKTFHISVEGKGPEDCESKVNNSIVIPPTPPPPCPVVNGITTEGPKEIGGDKVQFDFTANVSGGRPNNFVWNWIDGGQEFVRTEKDTKLSIAFDKQEKERRVRVNLNTQGPSNCRGNADETVVIPAKGEVADCPWYLKALPYAMALFLTMLICAVITCYVGISLGKAIEGAATDHLYTWTIVLAFLTIIGGFVWVVLGRKSPCGPRICNIALVLATALIGSGIFAAFLSDCFDASTLTCIILLVLGVAETIYYNMKCKGKHSMKQLAIFAVMGIIGVVLAISMHAEVSLNCSI